MKLHDKLRLQAAEFAKANNLPDTAIPQLTTVLLMGATFAMEELTPDKGVPSKAQKPVLVACHDDQL